MSQKTSNLAVGLVVFIAILLVTGYISAIVVDMAGISGYLVAIVTNSFAYLVYIKLTESPINAPMFFVFFTLSLGTPVLAGWLTSLMAITEPLIISIINAAVLGFAIITLHMTPKQVQKPPTVPNL